MSTFLNRMLWDEDTRLMVNPDDPAVTTYKDGLAYDDTDSLIVTYAGTAATWQAGIGFTVEGAMLVIDASAGLPADTVHQSGLPISAGESRLCVDPTNPVTYHHQGVSFSSVGAVAVNAGGEPPVDSENLAASRASLGITNFIFTNGAAAQLTLANFSSYTYTTVVTNTASYDGGPTDTQTDSVSGTSADLPGAVFFSPVDPANACAGPACPLGTFAIPPTTLFSQGIGLYTGAPIGNLDVLTTTAATTTGETSLSEAGHSGMASATLVMTVAFALNSTRTAGNLGFSFDASNAMLTWTDSLSAVGTTAVATTSWELKILGPGSVVVVQWIPDGNAGTGTQTGLTVSSEGCNQNRSSSAGAADPQAEFTSSGHQQALNSTTFLADTIYTLTLTQVVNTSVVTAAVANRRITGDGDIRVTGDGDTRIWK